MQKIINYLQGAMAEIKKVTWPTKKETMQYSGLVIVLSIVVAAFLGGLDYVFNLIIQSFLNRQLF